MSTLLEDTREERTQFGADPSLGVIEEARRRTRRRRLAVAVVLGSLVAGVLAALLAGGGAGHVPRVSAHEPRHGVASRVASGDPRGSVRVSPALEGGTYGWAVEVNGGGSCCTLPTASPGSVAIGAIAFWSPAEHEDTITALLSNGVRGFLEPGTRAKTTVLARLPYGLQLAQIKLVALRHPTVAHGALLALARHHKALGHMPSPSGVRSRARWWQRPASPPAGPCQLRAAGLSGLVPQWGHVATTVRPFPGHVIGRAFFSCVDTEYYLQGWPLDAAILLDAAHPGSPPAAIPGLSAVRGARGLLDGSGAFAGDITARRAGNAWLVVAGGDGLAQRLEVLRHLIPTISLPRT